MLERLTPERVIRRVARQQRGAHAAEGELPRSTGWPSRSLFRRARKSDQRLATLSLDSVIHFKSPADRAAFTHELANAVALIAARYHDEKAPGARPHRLVVASYPAPIHHGPKERNRADQES